MAEIEQILGATGANPKEQSSDKGISVAIPFHRLDSYLLAALDSVARDCNSNDEILLINDTNESSLRVKEWLNSEQVKLDSTLKIIENVTGGIVAARNLALLNARNEIVSFLDSDDVWVSGRRDLHLEAFYHAPEISGVTSNVAYVCEHGSQVGKSDIFHPKLEFLLGSMSRFFPRGRTSATSVRKSKALEAGGFLESESDCEDFGLWIRMQTRCGLIRTEPSIAAKYTLHPAQVSKAIGGAALVSHRALTLKAVSSWTSANPRYLRLRRKVIRSIEKNGLISWSLGYSTEINLRWIADVFSPVLVLLGAFLHLTARAIKKSSCQICESNE